MTNLKHFRTCHLPFSLRGHLAGVSGTRFVVETTIDDDPQYWLGDLLDDAPAQRVAGVEAGFIQPAGPPVQHVLNHGFVVRRGLREPDRMQEWVTPLTIHEKMAIIQHLGLALPPMLLPGIAYSRVLCVASSPETVLLVRELGVVCLLPLAHQPLPYDYEVVPLCLLHPADEDLLVPRPLAGVHLVQPAEVVWAGDRWWVWDNGSTSHQPFVCAWDAE
jgi:hypothetical protein